MMWLKLSSLVLQSFRPYHLSVGYNKAKSERLLLAVGFQPPGPLNKYFRVYRNVLGNSLECNYWDLKDQRR
jgi:hypothetical protein